MGTGKGMAGKKKGRDRGRRTEEEGVAQGRAGYEEAGAGVPYSAQHA